MNKQQALGKIASEIEQCNECIEQSIGKSVPGEGNPDAKIMFVGEAPGRQEAASGRPFIGRSGQLLRRMIHEVGLQDKEVYITSPVKYLPVYKTPKPHDIAHGKVHFDKQIDVINPEIIVLLGSVAAQAVLGEKLPVLKEHGKIISRNGRHYFLTIHPAAVLRNPSLKNVFLEDFSKLKKLIAQ